MATPRGAEHRDLEERFRKIERTQRELVGASLRRSAYIGLDSAQVDVDELTFPGGVFSFVPGTVVTVPAGFNRVLVTMFCTAGATFSTASGGNSVGVQPACQGHTGPPISTGTDGDNALSVSSSAAFALDDLTPGDEVSLDAYVARVGDVITGSCNYHISASLLFTHS